MSKKAHEFRQARDVKRLGEAIEEPDDDQDADGLHDGTPWRFDAPADTEGGITD